MAQSGDRWLHRLHHQNHSQNLATPEAVSDLGQNVRVEEDYRGPRELEKEQEHKMQARSTSIERLAGCLILQLAICLPALPLSKPAGSVSKGSASSQTASTTQVPADPAAARLVPARLQNEQGTFVLFKLQKPIGEEHYELKAAGDTSDLKSSIELTDRGMKESLKASLKMSSGLDPQHFKI